MDRVLLLTRFKPSRFRDLDGPQQDPIADCLIHAIVSLDVFNSGPG